MEAGDTNTTIRADANLFSQALTNVLDNAVKYAGPHVDLNVNCRRNHRYIELSIQDNGEALRQLLYSYILEKFYREPKPNHAVKGYGIGLSYVKADHGSALGHNQSTKQ